MKKDEKIKLIVNNETATNKVFSNRSMKMTNPIYGKYLEFTSRKTKKKITLRDFLNELF